MEITAEDIMDLVPDHIYKRGQSYYRFGRVQLIEVEPDRFKALVSGSDDYIVEVKHAQAGWIITDCTCPYWDDCKHVVAAMLCAKEYYENVRDSGGAELRTAGWRYYLAQTDRQSSARNLKSKWQLVYTLEIQPHGFTIRPQKVTIKQDGSFGALRNLAYGDYSDNQLTRTQNDNLALSFLDKFEDTRSFYSSGYSDSRSIYSFKSDDKVGVLFDLLKESQVYLRSGQALGQALSFFPKKVPLEFRLKEKGDKVKLQGYLQFEEAEEFLGPDYTVLCSDPIWLMKANCLFQVQGPIHAAYLLPFVREHYDVTIPREEVPQFLEAITRQTDLFEHFRLPDWARKETITEFSEKRIYLEEFDDDLQVKLRFGYKNVEVDWLDPRSDLWGSLAEEKVFYKVIRNKAKEQDALQELLATTVKAKRDGTVWTRKGTTMSWLLEEVPDLISSGFVVFGEQTLKRYKVNRTTAQVRVAVQSGIDWFDLKMEIDYDGIVLSLKELRKAIRQKSSYVKLSDGSTAKLPEEWLNRFRHVINLSESDQGELKLSHFHVTLIDELFAEAHQKDFDDIYHQRLERLKQFEGIEEVPHPPTLTGELRSYQSAGLSWLHFLNKFQFGGCLADDMGLGKTIQALSLLLSLKQNGSHGPALVVTPTSVVFNWGNEVKRFAPSLRMLNLTGSDRPRTMKNYDDYDLILTSYGTLRRDIIFLKEIHWNYIILDESQYIKNPLSQTAKAAKLLKGNHRLALTGTPVENNTLELWSLFSFLNPGLLGNLNYFKGAFAKPIEQNGDKETAELLRKLVFPFVLRRTKGEVEKDLPPKVENTIYCEMPAAQAKLYKQWRDYYRAALLKQIAEVGIDKSRMNVLEGLTKLRQIACHPLLIQDSFRGKVGKYQTLIENLDEILAEGHKILVFSQFVRMLTIIRGHLDSRKIPYEYLDGKTRDRQGCVERFQDEESCQIFLISLRAGGTGLNLTAAAYVFHYDPWWNPAVEAQATDRTHRIGQDKHVFVYKLISKGTVEEKILELQARKKELVSKLITTESSVFKKLSVNDIEVLFSD